MRMEQYLTHTDYALWEVILNGDSPVPEPPAVAIPNEHLLKFHSIKDAKSLWKAIKIRFGGNKESKKMHKTILKQQYKNFVASRSKGLDQTYDRFQKLISQLEPNGEVISQEDANMSVSEIDEDNNQAKDRYKVGIGYHAVSPPYTGNYMPPKADISFAGLDDSMFMFKIRQVLVNAAKQSSPASTSTTRPKVNIAAIRPNVNAKSSYFKPHFPKRMHFNQRSAAKTNTFSRKINTAKGKNVTTAGTKAVVNAGKGKKENVVKFSAC
nr:hypothetical protein [Tanacetum cinerariifolium]